MVDSQRNSSARRNNRFAGRAPRILLGFGGAPAYKPKTHRNGAGADAGLGLRLFVTLARRSRRVRIARRGGSVASGHLARDGGDDRGGDLRRDGRADDAVRPDRPAQGRERDPRLLHPLRRVRNRGRDPVGRPRRPRICAAAASSGALGSAAAGTPAAAAVAGRPRGPLCRGGGTDRLIRRKRPVRSLPVAVEARDSMILTIDPSTRCAGFGRSCFSKVQIPS